MKWILAAIFFGACYPVAAQLRFATYQYAKNDRLDNIRPAAMHLAGRVDSTAVVRSYPGVRELIRAIRQGEVDVAFINTFGYLMLVSGEGAHSMEPAVVWRTPEGAANNYRCIFFVPEKSPLQDSTDLAERAGEMSLLLVSEGSTSGNLVPRMSLAALGITSPEERFRSVSYGGTHQATAEKVATGAFSLGAVGSLAYREYAGNAANRPVRRIWQSPEIPLGPVLISKRLPEPLRNRIISEFVRLHQNAPEAFEAIKRGWSEAGQVRTYERIPEGYTDRLIRQFGAPANLRRILETFTD